MLGIKLRAGLLGLFALLAVSGIMVSTASAAGPFWHAGGRKLGQGEIRQIKLQQKGSTVLKSPNLRVELECTNSVSEGATIEGQGERQGQGKGRVVYSQCTVLRPVVEKGICTVGQPIITNQLKSYLATATPDQERPKQAKIVSVFEPIQGRVFVELHFGEACPQALKENPVAVIGAVAAELIPIEREGQEGLIAFPAAAITSVNHEGQPQRIALTAGLAPAVFSGVYAARLANFPETFGVFEQ